MQLYKKNRTKCGKELILILYNCMVQQFQSLLKSEKKYHQIFLFFIKETRLPKKIIDDVRNY